MASPQGGGWQAYDPTTGKVVFTGTYDEVVRWARVNPMERDVITPGGKMATWTDD